MDGLKMEKIVKWRGLNNMTIVVTKYFFFLNCI